MDWRPGWKRAAYLYAWDGADWTNLRVETDTYPNLRISLWDTYYKANIRLASNINIPSSWYGLVTLGIRYGYDGSNHEKLMTHKYWLAGSYNAPGVTSSFDTRTGFRYWTWGVWFSGTISTFDIRLEMSADNSHWFEVDNSTSTTDFYRVVVNTPFRYVRFNIIDITGTDATAYPWVFGMR